jgi:hypothetical protein
VRANALPLSLGWVLGSRGLIRKFLFSGSLPAAELVDGDRTIAKTSIAAIPVRQAQAIRDLLVLTDVAFDFRE